MSTDFDIVGIGNAIMDVIVPISDAQLQSLRITRGATTLIDEPRALTLYDAFLRAGENPLEIAGGSGANTVVGLSHLGLRTGFIGKVANDSLGEKFAAGMHAAGVYYRTNPLVNAEKTARCMIAVTPDGERSMSTFLGASVCFSESDIDPEMIKTGRVLYLEGYLYDRPEAKAAFTKAAAIAKSAGRKVALTLSDGFCVDRHRDDFQQLVDNSVDIVFANEAELLSLYECLDFDTALSQLSRNCPVVCVTRSAKGSVIVAGAERHTIPRVPVGSIVDTTGAGDQYAAGVLAGYALGLSWPDAGHLGSRCASNVIAHYGARPDLLRHHLETV